MNDVAQLKGSVMLSEVIGTYGIRLKKTGSEYSGLCPFHKESSPSFYVNNEKGLYYCHGCGASGDHIDFVKEHSKVDFGTAVTMLNGNKTNGTIHPMIKTEDIKIIPTPTQDHYTFTKPGYSMVHTYRNSDGEVLYKIARYEKTPSNPKKYFLPATHTESGWVEKAPTEGRVLYNLEALHKLPKAIVILVAGEKKCDQLQKIMPGNPVVSWMGGDTVFKKTDQSPLHTRRVIFWPDNDDGCKAITHQIQAEKLWVLQIPDDKPAKWDCGDAIDEGWCFDDVKKLIDGRVLVEAEKQVVSADVDKSVDKRLNQLLENVPGIVGKIARWIGETAKYPFPGLEFAAASVAVGVAMGHKYCSETDVRTNLYITGFAGASSGKDHARKCISKLLDMADVSTLEVGVPKSGAGLRSSIKKSSKGIILWDEIGLRFQGIGGHGAGSHQLEIFELLMQAYTSSDGRLIGEEYSNRDGTTAREDIYQPCLGIYGTSTKESFYDAMNSKLALNGFIPRWLVIDDNLPYRKGRDITIDKNPPESLVEEFKALCEKPLMYLDQMNNDYLRDHDPIVIPFDDDAKKLMDDFENDIVNRQNNEASKSAIPADSYRAIWGRAWVSTVKICLVCHEGESISLQVTKWAIELVSYLTNNMIADLSKYVSDNQHEANVKRLLDIIRNNKGITRERLTYKSRWARDNNHRADIIKTLVESGSIEILKDKNGTNDVVERFYIMKGK